jgi:hypothetical protein
MFCGNAHSAPYVDFEPLPVGGSYLRSRLADLM